MQAKDAHEQKYTTDCAHRHRIRQQCRLGTGHHLYRAGRGLWIGAGSMFSFLEVLPLILLVLEAIHLAGGPTRLWQSTAD